ncbi:hypothetical protein K450DRAFT_242861 [Umbelopsis ramanniana AG]|uniref:C3H1-type domain-containing protein n=1 Tax=Umbelopsis ramanniana AG TaxID=1314678 RepID=A0AAD5EAH4_UMBRA|nr:uncharacterized protein K450DRAFT_242861 [Umbelopsis ramanniana AG]KAI8579356.1 hypothetical protein K450DRAFT_242861 [Umbelopsis ramanniana AG]
MSQSFNDVTTENLAQLYPKILHTLADATFIAIDTEFTGLGVKGDNVRAANIEDRYQNMAKVVKSHALNAIGLTAFKRTSEAEKPSVYRVDNFNLLLSLQASYTVSAQSLRFLADSGFDFNKQIRLGLPYTTGSAEDKDAFGVKNLFRNILMDINRLQIPIIIHNGLMDLMYLYYSLYTDLPSNLQVFAADLSDMFPGGIYDTKYVSDYVSKEPVSFLSYLFKKYEREEKRRLAILNNPDQDHGEKFTKRCFRVEIQPPFPIEQVMRKAVDVEEEGRLDSSAAQASNSRKKRRRKNKGSSAPKEEKLYCEQYALHGYCRQNKQCGKSHDLDYILDEVEKSQKRKKTGITAADDEEAAVTPPDMNVDVPPLPAAPLIPGPSFYHSAHFDSYMTGYVFVHQLQEFRDYTTHANKLYLIGKDIPLPIQKSAFTSLSKGWQELKAELQKMNHGTTS